MADEIAYLKEEKDKAWDRIIKLEEELSILRKSIPENVQDIKNSSMAASKYRNRCEISSNKADEFAIQSQKSLLLVNDNLKDISSILSIVQDTKEQVSKNQSQVLEQTSLIGNKYKEITNIISEIEELYENHENMSEKVEQLNSDIIDGTKAKDDIILLYKQASAKRNEIYNLHREIIGYTEKNEETGEDEYFSGLKDDLEDSYNEISANLSNIDNDLNELKQKSETSYHEFVSNIQTNINNNIEGWEKRYISLKNKIENLLPDALTVGLSNAYAKKRYSEKQEIKGYQRLFRNSIIGLTLISLIPIAISIYSIYAGTTFDVIIDRLPKITIAFIPLYAPLLWVACSADKKIKLAKRLMEEYTHKEVLSKTYQGLSKQINALDDNETSIDLKTKLLYNLVSANSENPGKLITDYNTTDNPLMDALDKSTKLANAIEKLAKIPGFSKIAENLAKKSEKQQAIVKSKVDSVI